jgi:hypothetical protein
MSELSSIASIAGGWSFTPDWVHKLVIYGIPGAIVGLSVRACYKSESCSSKVKEWFGTKSNKNGSVNSSVNIVTNIQESKSANSGNVSGKNASPKPPNTPPTPVVTPPTNVKSTQGGHRTRRAKKHSRRRTRRV